MGRIGFAFGGRTIFAVTDRADVAAVRSEANEVLPDRVGALFAQGQIVLGSAANVSMAGDDNLGVGVVAEVVRQFIEFRPLFGFDGKAVVSEVDGFAFEGFVVGIVRVAERSGRG